MMANALVHFTPTVGVAPGTTTMQLGLGRVRVWNPYTDMIQLTGEPVESFKTDRPIRWDLVGVIGGGSLLIALAAAFIANAFAPRKL